MYIKFKGKFKLTRIATPTLMLGIVTEYTGKKYTRSMKGMEQALADLEEMIKAREIDAN